MYLAGFTFSTSAAIGSIVSTVPPSHIESTVSVRPYSVLKPATPQEVDGIQTELPSLIPKITLHWIIELEDIEPETSLWIYISNPEFELRLY